MQFDALETRSPEDRARDLAQALPHHIARAMASAPGLAAQLDGVDPASVLDRAALAGLPVLRKSALSEAQAKAPPFGGFAARTPAEMSHIFQSPGPIYEPGSRAADWWRLGRFLHAAGIGAGDIVQNCFSYHLTPAGLMFESGAAVVGAAVIPAGTGQAELQARAAADIGATAYAGTPDFLKVILEAADGLGRPLAIARAVVSGGALFPSLRALYAERGITTLQCYATADAGLIAYETAADAPMIVDEGVVLEIVTPGTGDPVPEGEVGEVVVTVLNDDYPLVRFATGDLSAIVPGISDCGRTNTRIKGWMGRADQTTKVRGMFVRPEQVAEIVKRGGLDRARLVVDREGEADTLTLMVEGPTDGLEDLARDVLRLRVSVAHGGSLPRDGKVIEDRRNYD